jgi:hypothetical protein
LDHVREARADLGDHLKGPDDCRGYEVLDPLGQRIGRADKLFVNGDGGPEYVRVRIGFVRQRSVLIPVESAEVDTERRTIVLG